MNILLAVRVKFKITTCNCILLGNSCFTIRAKHLRNLQLIGLWQKKKNPIDQYDGSTDCFKVFCHRRTESFFDTHQLNLEIIEVNTKLRKSKESQHI